MKTLALLKLATILYGASVTAQNIRGPPDTVLPETRICLSDCAMALHSGIVSQVSEPGALIEAFLMCAEACQQPSGSTEPPTRDLGNCLSECRADLQPDLSQIEMIEALRKCVIACQQPSDSEEVDKSKRRRRRRRRRLDGKKITALKKPPTIEALQEVLPKQRPTPKLPRKVQLCLTFCIAKYKLNSDVDKLTECSIGCVPTPTLATPTSKSIDVINPRDTHQRQSRILESEPSQPLPGVPNPFPHEANPRVGTVVGSPYPDPNYPTPRVVPHHAPKGFNPPVHIEPSDTISQVSPPATRKLAAATTVQHILSHRTSITIEDDSHVKAVPIAEREREVKDRVAKGDADVAGKVREVKDRVAKGIDATRSSTPAIGGIGGIGGIGLGKGGQEMKIEGASANALAPVPAPIKKVVTEREIEINARLAERVAETTIAEIVEEMGAEIANLNVAERGPEIAEIISKRISNVGEIDIDAYMGRWYQMYSSIVPTITYERNAYCVTQDLIRTKNIGDRTTFDVLNSLRYDAPDGPIKQATGIATDCLIPQIPAVNGLFFVDLGMVAGDESSWWQKIPGTYVIQALGPIVDNVYSWTIVSDVAKSSVWVTARNPSTFEESGEAAIALAKAQDLGFDMLFNNPIKSAQPVDCVYVPAEVVKKEKKDEEG